MSRRLYPPNRVRYWYAYDLDEICITFADLGLHVQTVRKWVKNGLKTTDAGKPTLIYGNDLIDFIKKQNAKGKCETPFDQMYCFKCHYSRPVYHRKVVTEKKGNCLSVSGQCRECKTVMFKNYKMDDLQPIRRTFDVVGVLELYDSENPTFKTHFPAQEKITLSESETMDLFNG